MPRAIRFLGIAAVFVITSIAWIILAAGMEERTSGQREQLTGEVAELWGRPQVQAAPSLVFHWDTERKAERVEFDGKQKRTIVETFVDHHDRAVSPRSSSLTAALHDDPRLKGLIWYPLYQLDFDGTWTYDHEDPAPGTLHIAFTFPDAAGVYDGFRFVVNGKDFARELRPENGTVAVDVPVKTGEHVELKVAYRTRGAGDWRYQPGQGVANLEKFDLTMSTDFANIDFPAGTLSPSSRERAGGGWKLGWTFQQVVTGSGMGMIMPEHVQPGELSVALTRSAPISLLFFFTLLFVVSILRGIDIHPVNYLFLAAAFFAFHLLFSYLADHLRVAPAFAVSSAVSVFLVLTYMRLVVSVKFALLEVVSQVVFLIGFSLAHFWKGYTGLTVTVLSILTLFVLMQLTGRIRWGAQASKTPALPTA